MSAPVWSVAPTAMTPGYEPGNPTVAVPSFPAAATTTMFAAIAFATASESTGSSKVPPSERLITLAPCVRAQSMPTAMSASLPDPVESRTLTGITLALGATPTTPRALFVRAATTPLTSVPCPLSSCGGDDGLNTLRPVTSWPARSGWFRSVPVSTTATVTPAPLP